MNEDLFYKCSEINDYLIDGDEPKARDLLIQLLDYVGRNNIQYFPLLNSLIREVGLYPYMDVNSSEWEDAFVYNLFKADIGLNEEKVLHREQFRLLSSLLAGKNIAVSAPTSFGKSFVIDAFIKLRKPRNVAIIVPTIALTDETRRRIYKKFANEYNIITTTDIPLAERNIFIFPQERALCYVNKIDSLDILIVDEFYKSSKDFEKERSASLIKAILKLGQIAKQKYYLAPNITKIEDNQFTKDMEFMKMDFNTVFLKVTDYYPQIGTDTQKKGEYFLNLNRTLKGKTLIYAGSFSNITSLSNLILETSPKIDSVLLNDFSDWLGKNYDYNWNLTLLAKRGVGVHNGSLHRSLSQIQIKLFEENEGLNRLISTSSIIEGVNTSAENVIVWMTSGRGLQLSNFAYKNLIGRAGRMFKHFIGNIYVLAKRPNDTETQLAIPFPEEILGDLDKEKYEKILTREQVAKIDEHDKEMLNLVGNAYKEYKNDSILQAQDSNLLKTIAHKLSSNPEAWECLKYLNYSNPDYWDAALYKILNLQPGAWDAKYGTFVEFVKILSGNWEKTIPELLQDLDDIGIGLDTFFRLERNVSFKLSSLISDVNILQKAILKSDFDLSPFISKLSSVFLPTVVYQLEEYGLPRMIAKKIQNSGLIDFEDKGLTLSAAISKFNTLNDEDIISCSKLESFEIYIYNYFKDGITQ